MRQSLRIRYRGRRWLPSMPPQWITPPPFVLRITFACHLESSLVPADGIPWEAAIDFEQVAFVICR
jgi:hypothetical protein